MIIIRLIRMDIKVILTINNPAYVGMCILDLSKVLMCELHCDYLKELQTIIHWHW